MGVDGKRDHDGVVKIPISAFTAETQSAKRNLFLLSGAFAVNAVLKV
jgi:hypothetical protein